MRGRYGGDDHVSNEFDMALCVIKVDNAALSLLMVGHTCSKHFNQFFLLNHDNYLNNLLLQKIS